MNDRARASLYDNIHRNGWEAISHTLQSPLLTVEPERDEEHSHILRPGRARVAFQQLPEGVEFLLQRIRTHSERSIDGFLNVSFLDMEGVGGKSWVCDLPIVLTRNEWHEINPPLRWIPGYSLWVDYAPLPFIQLGQTNFVPPAAGELTVFIGGILYRRSQ